MNPIPGGADPHKKGPNPKPPHHNRVSQAPKAPQDTFAPGKPQENRLTYGQQFAFYFLQEKVSAGEASTQELENSVELEAINRGKLTADEAKEYAALAVKFEQNLQALAPEEEMRVFELGVINDGKLTRKETKDYARLLMKAEQTPKKLSPQEEIHLTALDAVYYEKLTRDEAKELTTLLIKPERLSPQEEARLYKLEKRLEKK